MSGTDTQQSVCVQTSGEVMGETLAPSSLRKVRVFSENSRDQSYLSQERWSMSTVLCLDKL